MKKFLALALALVLCVPAFAAETRQDPVTQAVFTDVSADRWSYDVIQYCHEQGLVLGKGEGRFDPTGTLTVAQAVALAARLHRLTHPTAAPGSEVPALPDLSRTYVRFIAPDGTEIGSYAWGDEDEPWYSLSGDGYIGLSRKTDDPAIPETCTMEVWIDGYAPLQSFQGTRTFFNYTGGYMSHGLEGTGYTFADKNAVSVFASYYSLGHNAANDYKDAWWYPAAFYLDYSSGIDVNGSIVYRLLRNEPVADPGSYDPMTDFDKDPASRELFAWLLDQVIDEDLEVINDVSAVPDVDPDFEDAAAILRLYGAGIIIGVDQEGHFQGSQELTREQAAAMLARVLKSELRKKI